LAARLSGAAVIRSQPPRHRRIPTTASVPSDKPRSRD